VSNICVLASPRDSEPFEADDLIIPGYSKLSLASPFDSELRKAVTSLPHVVLLPGDLLFISERRWHYLQSVTPGVSVSRWWFDNRIAGILDSTKWQHDLAKFGGRDVLVEFLSQFTIEQQYTVMLALISRYGPDVPSLSFTT
jgi:hypothetical protein